MFGSCAWALLAVLAPVIARSPAGHGLKNNLAYLSPSKQIQALEIDLDVVHKRMKRQNPTIWEGNLTFPFGVASGDPYNNSVILQTVVEKLDPEGVYNNPSYYPICLSWAVTLPNQTFSSANTIANGTVQTTWDVQYAVKVEATGLQPYTQYQYRFAHCDDPTKGSSNVGLFKTLPNADAMPDQIRLATFSCSNLPFGFFNAYGWAANRSDQLDYWQHVGDYIYEYPNGAYGDGTALGRIPDPPDRECTSLQDYRDRYGAEVFYWFDEGLTTAAASYRRDPDLYNLHARLAVQAVWDDHEVADNSYQVGSADSNDTAQGYVNGLSFSQRKANAVRAYFEWMPIRQVDTDDQLRIWRTFQIGKLADMIMLDTRHYNIRSITDLYYNTPYIASIANDSSPDRSMTGAPQQSWFYDQLQQSEARGAVWRLVMQQVVFSSVNYSVATGGAESADLDAWQGYQDERRQVTKFISDNKINNTVILSGDSHATWAFDTTVDGLPYNHTTGEGAVGVEFAGTAVSSPSSYKYSAPDAYYVKFAEDLTSSNPHLQFAEGQLRGHFEMTITNTSITTEYWGFYDQQTRNSNATLIATLYTDAYTNRLRRPINNGTQVLFGALQGISPNSTVKPS